MRDDRSSSRIRGSPWQRSVPSTPRAEPRRASSGFEAAVRSWEGVPTERPSHHSRSTKERSVGSSTIDVALSSTLLEVELRSALAREGIEGADRLLYTISWILPDRRLTPEIDRVLGAGYARGADLQHLACALFAAESPHDLPFLTLDASQGELASALGFPETP